MLLEHIRFPARVQLFSDVVTDKLHLGFKRFLRPARPIVLLFITIRRWSIPSSSSGSPSSICISHSIDIKEEIFNIFGRLSLHSVPIKWLKLLKIVLKILIIVLCDHLKVTGEVESNYI